MQRILIWIVLLIAAGYLVRRAQRNAAFAQNPRATGSGPARRPTNAQLVEPMVQCAQCGAHLPRSESLRVADTVFCSEAHARAHTGTAPRAR
ncbi:MAG: PP0621 family protein [Janthinobacterium lividum]